MQKIDRLLVNILSEKLQESAAFYVRYFDFKVDFESNWFIHLISESKSLELGLIDPKSEVVPQGIDVSVGGLYLTFVIDGVDHLFGELQKSMQVLEPPHDTFYGQRRLLVKDINGVTIDISSPIKS